MAAHRRRVLLAAFLLTLAALPLAWRAVSNLDVNLFNQASDSLQRFKLMRELSEEFGGDILAAVVSIPDHPTPRQVAELKAFGSLLCAELAKVGALPEDAAALPEHIRVELARGEAPRDAAAAEGAEEVQHPPWLRQVECRTGQGIEQTLRRIARQQPYVILTPQDVQQLNGIFEPARLAESLKSIKQTLEDLPPNSAERLKLQEDPMGIAEMGQAALKTRLAQRRQALANKDPDGFFLSPDQTTLVVLGRAALPATRLDFDRALMAAAQRAENRAIAAFRATQPGLSVALKGGVYGQLAAGEQPGMLKAGFTGMPAVSVENEMSLKYDLLGNTATSFVGVLLLFLIVFRRALLAWDVTWTTALVIVWTLAVAGATKGSISILGGAFTCILLGTGTDYAIHLHNAYHGFRHGQGLAAAEALRLTLTRCGPGIITASLTTALAFFGVGFTRFAGLAEFGLLAGVSIILGCLMMLIVFPALLCRGETGAPRSEQKKPPEALGMGLPQWGRLLEKPGVKGASLAAGIALLLGALALIRYGPDPGSESVAGVRFDTELGNLRSLRIQAIPLRNRLAERFGLGLADVRVVVEAADEATAFAGAEEVVARLQPFLAAGELSHGGNVLDFIPSPRQQQASLDALKRFDFESAAGAFRAAAAAEFGDNALKFFKPFLRRLHDFHLLTREPNILTLSSVMRGPLGNVLAPLVRLEFPAPAAVGDKPAPSRVRLASSWFPARLDMKSEWYDRVASTLASTPLPGATIRVTAARMVGFEMKDSLLRDCAWISVVVGISVAIALAVAFRSLGTSLLALIPLLYAYAAMLAGVTVSQIMGWDFSLNFVNLIMFPLLLGSGIDVGIYMVYEALSPRRPSISALMAGTGRSVLCCTLTTLVGFGSFFWSSYTGLISLGMAAIFGYTGALFGALVVLPALLGLRRARDEARGLLPREARALAGAPNLVAQDAET